MQIQQCYEILQLSPNASKQQIKQAYYRSARLYHADISENPDSEQFIKIHQAYKSLMQSERHQSQALSLYHAPTPLYRRLYKNICSYKLSLHEAILFSALMLLVPGYYRAQAWQQQSINVPLIQKQLAIQANQLQAAYQQCFNNQSIATQTQCIVDKQQKMAQLHVQNFSDDYQVLIQKAIKQHEFYYAEQLLEMWETFEQTNQQAVLWYRLALEREVLSQPQASVVATIHQPVQQVDKAAQFKQQLARCDAHLQANRLTKGKQGYALQCYQHLLNAYPNHHQVIQAGFIKIEQRLVNLAKQALKQKNISQAKTYVVSLKKVNRHSPSINRLQSKIKTLQNRLVAKTRKPVAVKKAVVKTMNMKCRRLLRQFSMGMKPLSQQEKRYISQQCY
ncbi:J domain-containing protein [Candidatus Albibeggiatoa sp. nov. NOAA]|uniref:J domain-containing protein n=1 Tax=Candidatus Albibeggiatoa sp. nov. NOAA TaxID=3162724 RepID=UPI003304CBB0|nr:J domain-containing protein [Thiotrichaceae bacterium]